MINCKECMTYTFCRNKILELYQTHDAYNRLGAYINTVGKVCFISNIYKEISEYKDSHKYKPYGTKLSELVGNVFNIEYIDKTPPYNHNNGN